MELRIVENDGTYNVIVHVQDKTTPVEEWCDRTGIYGQWDEQRRISVDPITFYPAIFGHCFLYFNNVSRHTMLLIKLGLA